MNGRNQLMENRWLYPGGLGVLCAVLLVTFVRIRPSYFTALFGADKFESTSAYVYFAGFWFTFAAGFLAGYRIGPRCAQLLLSPRRLALTPGRLRWLLAAAAALVLIGHISLFWVGRSVLGNLQDAITAKQEVKLTGTGAPLFLITLTPLFSALLGYALFSANDRSLRLTALALITAAVPLIIIRFMYFERLPMFEFLVPLAWFGLRRLSSRTVLALTLAGIAGFFCLFSLAEYFRSWPAYLQSGLYNNTPGDFAEFIFYRVVGYYITPINHLSALFQHHMACETQGYYSFRGLINMPVLGKVLKDAIPYTGHLSNHSDFWVQFLDPHFGLNPEYNLFGCYGVAYLDWGWGGLILALAFGFMGGTLLGGSNQRASYGVFGFPIFVIGLGEYPRLLYWPHERVLLCFLGLGCLSFLFRLPASAPRAQNRHPAGTSPVHDWNPSGSRAPAATAET